MCPAVHATFYRENFLAYLITFAALPLAPNLISYGTHGFRWAILVAVLVTSGLLLAVLALLSRGVGSTFP